MANPFGAPDGFRADYSLLDRYVQPPASVAQDVAGGGNAGAYSNAGDAAPTARDDAEHSVVGQDYHIPPGGSPIGKLVERLSDENVDRFLRGIDAALATAHGDRSPEGIAEYLGATLTPRTTLKLFEPSPTKKRPEDAQYEGLPSDLVEQVRHDIGIMLPDHAPIEVAHELAALVMRAVKENPGITPISLRQELAETPLFENRPAHTLIPADAFALDAVVSAAHDKAAKYFTAATVKNNP